MKPTIYFRFVSLSIIGSLVTTISVATELDLSDEKTAKDLLLNKKLHCQMDEQNYHGPEIIKVVKIQGNKFTGFSDFWCWRKGTTYKGTLKKNSLKWSQQEHSGCYCRSGNLNFFKGNDGNLKAEGNYGVGCGSNTFQGTIKCVVIGDEILEN